jgi:phosphoribosyl 1,2-cyclic phosphate phosphodiesterase
MEFTILGSGGNTPTPMPTCDCSVCEEAREAGVPYTRRGNSVFLHEENVLIDAPELVWESLNREGIASVDHVFISHFHADHTLGLRSLQPFGIEAPPVTEFVGDPTTVYMSEVTYERTVAANEVFGHLADAWASVEVLGDGETRSIGDLEITHLTAPIQAGGADAVSGFLFESGDSTAFVSPDENRHFDLGALPALDLWIKECGYFSETPDGEPLVTEEAERHALAHEMTFQESLEQVRRVHPDRAVLTEIEELYRRSYDDYLELQRQYEPLGIEFAHDGLRIEM